MAFQDDYMNEIRANIARAEQAEKERIAKIVEVANADVNRHAAEREAAERAAEQEREAAQQEREQQRIEAAREQYRQAIRTTWMGTDAEFDEAFPGLWKRHQKEQARQDLERQQYAAREAYRRTF
ncbi:MAG TPA: hypothetical protein VGJ87_14950 [Roseiflexaceae bacterium]|jgi:hypothetical protein